MPDLMVGLWVLNGQVRALEHELSALKKENEERKVKALEDKSEEAEEKKKMKVKLEEAEGQINEKLKLIDELLANNKITEMKVQALEDKLEEVEEKREMKVKLEEAEGQINENSKLIDELLAKHKITEMMVKASEEDKLEKAAVGQMHTVTEEMDSNHKDFLKGVVKDHEFYDMNHKRTGFAIIFNHMNFDPKLNLKERRGTNVDRDDLFSTLTQLGFQVEILDDPTFERIENCLDYVSGFDHSDSDCILIAVLSHGTDGDYVLAYDQPYKTDNLWSRFTKCKTLVGKPKMFLIQACRGGKLDYGTFIEHDGPNDCDRIASNADILIAYCSAPGFNCHRDQIAGSRFIQAFCQVLGKEAYSRDILSILTRVANKVASAVSLYGTMQIPSVVSQLTKDIVFTRKGRILPSERRRSARNIDIGMENIGIEEVDTVSSIRIERIVKLGYKHLTPPPLPVALHWAVKVGDFWYEVEGSSIKESYTEMVIFKERGDRAPSGVGSLVKVVGATNKTDEEIAAWIEDWKIENPIYDFLEINCQKFGYEFIRWLTGGVFSIPLKLDSPLTRIKTDNVVNPGLVDYHNWLDEYPVFPAGLISWARWLWKGLNSFMRMPEFLK